jgi:hypothetical protein
MSCCGLMSGVLAGPNATVTGVLLKPQVSPMEAAYLSAEINNITQKDEAYAARFHFIQT